MTEFVINSVLIPFKANKFDRMKKYLYYFVISLAVITTLSLQPTKVASKNIAILDSIHAIVIVPQSIVGMNHNAQLDSILAIVKPFVKAKDLPTGTTPSAIVMWLLRVLGSLLATVVLALLHKWFPKWFPSSTVHNYIKGSENQST